MRSASNKGEDQLEFSNRCLYALSLASRHMPVIKKLYPALLKQWARLTWTGGYKVKRFRGSYLLLNYKNALDRKIGLHGGHEPEQSAYFFAQMKKGCDIFIDIGANMGTYTLQAARLGGVKEVHAFEPDPRSYAQLLGNLYMNKYTDIVRAYPVALSDANGTLSFEMGADNKPELTKVSMAKGETKKLMARMLDDVLQHYRGKKIFIKIDAEGHEREILKGAVEILKNNACFLQVEAWPINAAVVSKKLEGMRYHCIHHIHNTYYFSLKK